MVDPDSGHPSVPGKRTWTDVFANQLCALGADHSEIVAITAALSGPTGLRRFGDAFPDRLFDVGICEQHALTCAAGIALGGLHPIVAVHSAFLGRMFDQVLMDLALHELPVTIVLDRAGITAPDGPSQHGVWDLAVLSAVPGLRVAAPRDPERLRELLTEAVTEHEAPTVVRFPKATKSPTLSAIARMDGLDFLYRSPACPLDVLLVSAGVLAQPCVEAADILARRGIGVTVVDPRWILPIHPALIHLAARHRITVTAEDGIRVGGVGSCLTQAGADAGLATPIINLGPPRAFLPRGRRPDLLTAYGLDSEGIAGSITLGLARVNAARVAATPPVPRRR